MPTHVPLKELYFGGCLIDSASNENVVGTAVILDFLSYHHHYKGVKQFRKVFQKATTLSALEVSF